MCLSVLFILSYISKTHPILFWILSIQNLWIIKCLNKLRQPKIYLVLFLYAVRFELNKFDKHLNLFLTFSSSLHALMGKFCIFNSVNVLSKHNVVFNLFFYIFGIKCCIYVNKCSNYDNIL